MEIISFQFFLFALIVIIIYSGLAIRAQNIWLLIASYGFYLTWGVHYALILLLMTFVNYQIGLRVGMDSPSKKKWLNFGVWFNVLLLVVLKLLSSAYSKSFFDLVLGEQSHPSWAGILLPVGFSFYALQAISYLVDVSRGQVFFIADPINFALYLAYFPKMLSGPIERAAHFVPQLKRERKVDNQQIGRGVGLILVGLMRKLVIADGLRAIHPANIFSNPVGYSMVEHIIWLIVFAFTLYNDFAGYTSIVRGISALMGIELSANFSQPFFAHSFGDFWNRWHISLSTWLRDYIFFPVRRWCLKKKVPGWVTLVFPPMITMLVSGYWHGASVAMLAWGGIHGVYQIVEQKFGKRNKVVRPVPRHILSVLVIFVFVTFAWIPFASMSFDNILPFMLGFFPPYRFDFPSVVWVNLIVVMSASLGLDWQEYKASSDTYFLNWSAKTQSMAVFCVLLIIVLFAGGGPDISNFIYQGF